MITLEKLVRKKEKNERGIVLVLSLLMLTILSILALSFLTLALHENNIAHNYTRHTQAFFVAEAGVEKAINELNLDPTYTGEPTTAFGSGTYDVTVEELSPGLYRITGNGQVLNARSSIQVVVNRPLVPMFPFAAYAGSEVYMDNNSQTDSYSCEDGSPGTEGDIGSGGNITLDSNVAINGDVYAGGSINATGNAVVNGTEYIGTTPVFLSPIDAGAGMTDLVVTDETITLAAGTYYFRDVSIQGTGELKISGKVTIYLTGSFYMNKGTAGNVGGDPRNLSILTSYVSASATDYGAHLNNDAVFVGTIYGPDAALYMDNSTVVYGSLVGEWITVDNNALIHYAECLADGGNVGFKVQVLNWNQVR